MTQEPGHNKTATSRKLDWLGALAVDPAVKAYAFKVGFAIVQHVNARSGWAMVSDETLADETSMAPRHVRRGRELLRERGWIERKRTKTANLYRPLSILLNSALDLLTTRRDHRQERRARRRAAQADAEVLSHQPQQDAEVLSRTDAEVRPRVDA
jgi:hypothetical protein